MEQTNNNVPGELDIEKKWSSEFLTEKLISILKASHPSPEVEMKRFCYIASMITSCFQDNEPQSDIERE